MVKFGSKIAATGYTQGLFSVLQFNSHLIGTNMVYIILIK